jgi:hypothetical protein
MMLRAKEMSSSNNRALHFGTSWWGIGLCCALIALVLIAASCRKDTRTPESKTGGDRDHSSGSEAKQNAAPNANVLPVVAELKAKYPSAFDSPCVSPYSDGLFHPTDAINDFRGEPFSNTNIFAFEAIAKGVEVQLKRIAESERVKVISLRDICDKDQLDAAGFEDSRSLPGNRIYDLDATQQVLLDGLNDPRITHAAKDELSTTLKSFPNFTWVSGKVMFDGDLFKVGDVVKVRGQGLTGAMDVTFGRIPAASFQVISDTYLTAVIPSGATGGHLTVMTPKGKLISSRSFWIESHTP